MCEGYSKILQQALKCVGIDCKIVHGRAGKEPHAWNQVNIDGVWYNCDLTSDVENIKRDEQLSYCLEDDETFKDYNIDDNSPKEVCDKHYNKIKKEIVRGNVIQNLKRRGFTALEYKIDEEIQKRAYLLNKGFTTEEAKRYMYERGMAQTDEEKEVVWEKYHFIKLKHIEEGKKQAKPAKEQMHGTIERAVEYLINCADRGESVYVNFNGHRLYSCDISIRKAYIEITGLSREEFVERNEEYFAAKNEEEKDRVIEKYAKIEENHRKREEEEKKEDKRIIDKYTGINLQDVKKIATQTEVVNEIGNNNAKETIEKVENTNEIKKEKSINDNE